MKRQIQFIFLFIILIVINHSAFGVIAYPFPVEIIQPDGSKITIIQKGDEYLKWAQTVDGYSILRNSKGIYEYVTLNANNDMVPSGVKARNLSERSTSDMLLLKKTKKGLTYSKSQIRLMKSISVINQQNSLKSFPTTGTRKLVCILMGFTDKAFTKTKTDFENLFNQVGYNTDGATGSVNDYYKESSYNQLDLSVTVAGPYTASHNMAYYGANDGTTKDKNARALITEAVTQANPFVNFANFDNDNDGTVEGVYVIFAGYGEEYSGTSSDAIWSHASSITPLNIDGVTVSRYSCSSELRENSGTGITRIGVICHEFSHVLGTMDFYDTDNATNGQYDGNGMWDLMASGNWNNNGATPAHQNAYSKIYDFGWTTATTLTSVTNITLSNAEQNSNSFYRINTTTSNEFFLIENRQKQKFDTYIPGHGMIIYHVDGNFINSNGNAINTGSHQGMYPICANATGNPPTDYGTINSGGLSFPGSGNKTSFTDATTPNALSWAGGITNKPITNITENTLTKTVSFNLGLNPTAPTATTNAASEITTKGATLNALVNPNNASTTITFEIGTTTNYGTSINGIPNIINGNTLTEITASISGLNPNTTYNYRVKAINSIGTTYGSNKTFTTDPTPLNLPLTENFDTTVIPTGWTTQNIGTGIIESWSISNTAKAGGDAYELKCSSQDINPGTIRFITPAINTIGLSRISLSFKHLLDNYGPGAILLIQSSKDKVTWTNENWSLASNSDTDIGPTTVNTTITNNLNAASTYIAFVVEGNLFYFDYWYIDNVLLTNGSSTSIPTLTTTAVSTSTSTTVISGGNITTDGGTAVTARGVCWSTTANPTIALITKTTDGSGVGAFTSNITGLIAGTNYHVRAYATNAIGTGYGSDIIFTSNTLTAPIAITASNINQTSFTANWNIVVTATGYRLDVATDNTFTTIISGYNNKDIGNLTSFNVTGLSANISYYYRLKAYNASGTSDNSTNISVTTLSNPPSFPPAINASNILQTSFTAKWGISLTATSYRLDVATDNNFTTLLSGYNNKDIGNLTSHNVTGLIANTTYYYRVRAYNSGGNSVNSNTIIVITLPDPPSAPTAIPPINVLQTSFTAKWNSSTTATGYQLDIATNSGFTDFVTDYSVKDVWNVTTYNVSGLSAKTQYYYRVRAYNTGGIGVNSITINVTTLSNPPIAPTGLTGSSCNDFITLIWKKSIGPEVIGYHIYGGLINNPSSKIDSTTNASDTLKVISGLISGKTYYFSITAVNQDGPESVLSNPVYVLVKKGVVPIIKAKWGDVLICSNLGDSISSFQWYKGGSKILNAINQYYVTDKQPGAYMVQATDNNGCINFSNTISISGTKSLSVYPNPASVSFVLKINDQIEGRAVVRIINSSGIKVLEFQAENHHNELLKEIPVSNLEPGIYIVQVLMEQKVLYYTKIVVIK